MTDVPDRVADRRVRAREAFTLEFLALATVLLPTFAASVGFFFGRPVTPLCLYVSVAALLACAFACGWRRGVAYAALVAVSAALTAFTFSYSGPDAQSYHFPVQFLLRHGWNPVFDSTLEKFAVVAGDAQLAVHHALFLPRAYELCGAIVSSALRLFVGDAFAGYVLLVVLSAAVLAALAGLSLLRTLAFQGRMLVEERLRQNLIASFPADRPVRVSAGGYRFTNVQRFRQAGRTLVKAADGEADTVLEPETALPRFDTHPEIRADLDARFPLCNGVRSLFVTFRWADVFRNLPRPLRE